jgi:hypothetical protein
MNDTGFRVDKSKADRVTSIFTCGPGKHLISATAAQGQRVIARSDLAS